MAGVVFQSVGFPGINLARRQEIGTGTGNAAAKGDEPKGGSTHIAANIPNDAKPNTDNGIADVRTMAPCSTPQQEAPHVAVDGSNSGSSNDNASTKDALSGGFNAGAKTIVIDDEEGTVGERSDNRSR